MIHFIADENFNRPVVLGVHRLRPEIDIVRVQDAGLSGIDDAKLLDWAALQRRIVLTHDVSTMTFFAYERVKRGLAMPGVFIVTPDVEIAEVIESVVLIALCSEAMEWQGQVRFLPL